MKSIKPISFIVKFIFCLGMITSCQTSQKQLPIQQMTGFPDNEPGYESGVSACYAGIIGEKLIMAGGCNFPETPAAEGGAKRYYKGIYAADTNVDSVLVWKRIGQLPAPAAYGTSIPIPRGIIWAGGNNSNNGFSSVYRITLSVSGDSALLDSLPPLPCTIDNMTGAVLNNTLYILGGNQNGEPSTSVFSLQLDSLAKGWITETPFPGEPRVQPICAASGDKLYLWSGFTPPINGKSPMVHTDGYCYDPQQKKWKTTASPISKESKALSLSGGGAITLNDSLILCTGGVDKDIFEDAISGTYHKTTREEYLMKPVEWYRFNGRLMVYNTKKDSWAEWNTSPWMARAGAALIASGKHIYCIGGELKPGIRTATVCKILTDSASK